ncbi:MAG: adenylyl-sulfate kinase [Psychroflexus sp.]|nr:adenylyl-sulfate kinase [Psychroflexus sp.]MDR9448250.1 adenylyl-sulfate kinase [Psychroflexus sp.]
MNENIVYHQYEIDRNKRCNSKNQPSFVVWFTGLSGSGKSTIASLVEQQLFSKGMFTYTLDGDNIRRGINKGLGFSREDRKENLRRIAEVAKLFVDSGMITIAAFISPLKQDREMIKSIIGGDDYVEVFVDTSVEECERRDVKGLYKKARAGEIKNFTGINAPYEKPENPDVVIKTEEESIDQSVEKVIKYLTNKIEAYKHE